MGETQNEAPENGGNGARSAEGERLICRRTEDSTSRMGTRRVCRTAEQWREAQRDR